MQVAATSSNSPSSGSAMDLNPTEQKEMFLRLMITQLQNQDPINPVGNEDFLAQMAQFTSVEQMLTMVQKLDAMAADGAFNKSVSLIGHTVDYISDEDVITGVEVTAVSTVDGQSSLVLSNGDKIDIADVVRVQ